MSDAHMSDLRWDRWLAGELPADDAAAALAHAAACATCGARMRELTACRDAFAKRPACVAFARPRWRARGFAAVAAAAAVVIVAVRLVLPVGPGAPGERSKGGGPDLVLAVGRAGALLRLSSGDTVHPGESLQAGYTAERDGFGAVLSLDGAGAASAYVPAGDDRMVELPAGVDRSFPASTVLDRVVGGESVAVVWCPAAHPLAPLLDELRATRTVTPPPGCHARVVVLDKRGAP